MDYDSKSTERKASNPDGEAPIRGENSESPNAGIHDDSYPDIYPVEAGTVATAAGSGLLLPGSKSITQRYFNLALVARRPLVVRRPLESEDPELFKGALAATGFRLEERPDGVSLVPGEIPAGGRIFCGNGGTMFRFLTAALTTVPGTWHLDGIPRLRERPVGPLVEALRSVGARVECPGEEGYAPLVIEGGSLEGGRTVLDASASSQYLSALMMAGLAARRAVEVEVPRLASEPYVDLTFDAVAELGGKIERDGDVYRVDPADFAPAIDTVTVEGDFSAAAYPAAAAALAGGSVELEGLRRDSRQGDRAFIELLAEMGAVVEWSGDTLRVGRGELNAVDADLSAIPDQVPTLAALAPFARGTTHIRNVAHLRIKESDRLAAMARELTRLGAEVEEKDDGLVIPGIWADGGPALSPSGDQGGETLSPSGDQGGKTRPPVEVDTHNDHRIAMSLALVGLRRGGIRIRRPGVVVKSYPGFWRDLERLKQSLPPLIPPMGQK